MYNQLIQDFFFTIRLFIKIKEIEKNTDTLKLNVKVMLQIQLILKNICSQLQI